jgi:hypothetical protein
LVNISPPKVAKNKKLTHYKNAEVKKKNASINSADEKYLRKLHK